MQVRGLDAFEHIFVERAAEWHAAVEACMRDLPRALHQDVTECIEGRMAINGFSIHFQARSHRISPRVHLSSLS